MNLLNSKVLKPSVVEPVRQSRQASSPRVPVPVPLPVNGKENVPEGDLEDA